MLTLYYPLEVDHSLTRRWPEKTCFRMLGRAIIEYLIHDRHRHVATRQHADYAHSIDVSQHADFAHSV